MKSTFLILLAAVAICVSCNKVDTSERCARINLVADTTETATLKAFLKADSISAIEDPRGFFYTINRQSTDSLRPTICSKVTASYTGRLTNGTQFDAQNGAIFYLSNVIAGWQEGVPLIGKGGFITLYLPPSLGYGSSVNGSIPASSILVFYIQILNIE